MAILDKNKIIEYLQYIDKNGGPIDEEEKAEYMVILKQIGENPSLQAFLEKKFGEIMIQYIGEQKERILEKKQEIGRNSEGYYVLDGVNFIERKHNGPGVFAIKWIMIKNRPVLIKSLDRKNDIATTLISEQIAREAGYEVASYFPAILEGKKVIITPSFLKTEKTGENGYFSEEIIQGKVISGENMDISENPELIRTFFRKKGVSEPIIDNLIEKYKSVMLFNIFINLRDGHNGNWGVIVGNNNQYRFTPVFDLEGGLSENDLEIRPINIHGEYEDSQMLEYLLSDERMREYAERLMKVDMNNVYNMVERLKGIKISDEIREINTAYIQKGKIKIQKALDKVVSQNLESNANSEGR